MAGLVQFDDTFNGSSHVEEEEDPAAEFLAREQYVLAGLEDDSFDTQGAYTNDVGTGDPIEEFVAQNYDDVQDEVLQINGGSFDDNHVNDVSNSRPTIVREEPEKIRIWREEQQEMLQKKDAEEALKKEELQQTAKRELEDWYSRYKEQIEKSKTSNRNAEKEWVADRDTVPPGQDWERIAKLCDFNVKSSRNTKDTSRIRSIILQLKQSPPAQARQEK